MSFPSTDLLDAPGIRCSPPRLGDGAHLADPLAQLGVPHVTRCRSIGCRSPTRPHSARGLSGSTHWKRMDVREAERVRMRVFFITDLQKYLKPEAFDEPIAR